MSETEKKYVFETLERIEDDCFYENTINNDDATKEELYVHVLAPELEDEKSYACNMCSEIVERSVCLHYCKEYDDHVIEEEIILCKSCTEKLSRLLQEVKA